MKDIKPWAEVVRLHPDVQPSEKGGYEKWGIFFAGESEDFGVYWFFSSK